MHYSPSKVRRWTPLYFPKDACLFTGTRAYMVRRVLQENSDTVCIDMLERVVPAMCPDPAIGRRILLPFSCLPCRPAHCSD